MSRDYAQFFLNSKSSIVLIECIELTHPDFSQTHRVVRNVTAGVTVTHEDSIAYSYVYYPLKITRNGSIGDLDYGLQIEFGDLGGNLQLELDLIASNNGFDTKPVCKMRGYRSDDLSKPIHGPLTLEVNELAFNKDGAQFDAVAPYQNQSSTGRLYTLNQFPMLRGFL